jgi:glycosyltransferase involved in cell wall biosynthesis
VLSGLYSGITFIACAAVLALRGKPWAVWLERPRATPYRVSLGRRLLGARPVRAVKRGVLRWMLRRASRVIGIGSAAVAAYGAMGADRGKLLMLPYCCDTQRFERVPDEAVRAVRGRYALDDKTVFLFSGQMIERKGVDVALRAFERLAADRDDVAMLLLGDGPMAELYRASVPAALRDRVHFTGFLPQEELPAHFAAADVFVFPSRHDGWAVVINEACAAGLAVIASRQTGAAGDLVREGENGFVLDSEDVAGFSEKMRWFADRHERVERFGGASRELVARFSVEVGAKRFCEHVEQTMGGCAGFVSGEAGRRTG